MTTPPTVGQAVSTPIHQASFLEKLDLVPGLLSIGKAG
jgi:hypothetical protein